MALVSLQEQFTEQTMATLNARESGGHHLEVGGGRVDSQASPGLAFKIINTITGTTLAFISL